IVLLRALRAPDLDIRYAPVNVAKSSRIAKDLLDDPRTRAMIVEANQADLELYRHVKEELFPAMERGYGPSLADSVAAFRDGQAGTTSSTCLIEHQGPDPQRSSRRLRSLPMSSALLPMPSRKRSRNSVASFIGRSGRATQVPASVFVAPSPPLASGSTDRPLSR